MNKNCECGCENTGSTRKGKKSCKFVKALLWTLGIGGILAGGYWYANKKGVLKRKKSAGSEMGDIVGIAIVEEDKYYPSRNWSNSAKHPYTKGDRRSNVKQ